MSIPVRELIPALLQFAKEKDVDALTTTALVKYVYLIDVYSAEFMNGALRATDVSWQFVKFGPHSFDLAESLDEMAKQRVVHVTTQTSPDDGKSMRLFALPPTSHSVRSLKDLGVPPYVTLKLATDLRKYKNNLSALLDYVYFKTAPMAGARPTQELVFDQCTKRELNSYKPALGKKLTPEETRKAKQLIKNIAARHESVAVSVQPRYDDVYFAGLGLIEGEPIRSLGFAGEFEIREDKNGDAEFI